MMPLVGISNRRIIRPSSRPLFFYSQRTVVALTQRINPEWIPSTRMDHRDVITCSSWYCCGKCSSTTSSVHYTNHRSWCKKQSMSDRNTLKHLQSNKALSQTSKRYYRSSNKRNSKYIDTSPRTSLLMELKDTGVGVLQDILQYFCKYKVNILRIESRPRSLDGTFEFFVDIYGTRSNSNVSTLLHTLQQKTNKLYILDGKKVHWFPRHLSECDLIANRILDAGTDLQADHPGFQDPIYRQRRAILAQAARDYTWDDPIPFISYTAQEISVWTTVWDKMIDLWPKYACAEYWKALQDMQQHCNYQRERIPQPADVCAYLQERTNFRIRPVAGLLSSRDFLNGLAFRVFFCTQYIRHHSKPLYTPEPDICHELLGHAPLLANPDFAELSQEIGLASLGASDEDVDKLARCYWHSVEFGLCRENGILKAYGAGLLSSYGELDYACGIGGGGGGSDKSDSSPRIDQPPQILPWDPEVAAQQDFPITTYQPVYFLANSLHDAKLQMRHYCRDIPRPFFALHNPQTNSVHIDRPVQRTKGVPALDK